QNRFGGQPSVRLQPVDYASRPNYFLRSVVALLAVLTLACSGWFFWKGWSNRGERRSVVAVNEAKSDSAAQSNTPPQPSAHKSVIHVSTNIVVRTNVTVERKGETNELRLPRL